MRALILTLILSPAMAQAACPDQTVLSCPIGKKQLEVCLTGATVTYAFGPKGAPELTLSEPLETVAFTPWPGVGGAIWQSVAFTNNGTTYEVWDAIQRGPDETSPREGGINVLRDDALQAQLDCKTGTVTGSVDMLYDAKTSAGQCWNTDSFQWGTCPAN